MRWSLQVAGKTEILGELDGQGVIEVGRRQIRVINRPALEGFARHEEQPEISP